MSNHIVLFLKPNTSINFEEFIINLENNYKKIGKGIIINKNINDEKYMNYIFKENKDLIIEGNNHHISINILGDYINIKNDIIEMLWDAFDYNDLEFGRVGFIIEQEKKIDDINSLKTKLFNKNLISEINEFQVSFHNDIKFQKKEVNCWKRFVKFKTSPLFITYDINTMENTEINYKFLKEFIDFSENYINEDIKEFVKE